MHILKIAEIVTTNFELLERKAYARENAPADAIDRPSRAVSSEHRSRAATSSMDRTDRASPHDRSIRVLTR